MFLKIKDFLVAYTPCKQLNVSNVTSIISKITFCLKLIVSDITSKIQEIPITRESFNTITILKHNAIITTVSIFHFINKTPIMINKFTQEHEKELLLAM